MHENVFLYFFPIYVQMFIFFQNECIYKICFFEKKYLYNFISQNFPIMTMHVHMIFLKKFPNFQRRMYLQKVFIFLFKNFNV